MNHPEEAPKLSKFPFIIGDLVLIAAAILIATRSPAPIAPGPLLAIALCTIFGAALLVVPFLVDYARRQDAELTDRQRQIAALARTTAESAEQLGIATVALHSLAESSQHNLEALGKLPARLQEQLDKLPRQPAGAVVASPSKETLAQLEAVAEKISRSLAKLDTATQAKANLLAATEKELADAVARATTQLDAFASVIASTPVPVAAPATTPAPLAPPSSEEPGVVAPAASAPAAEPKPKSPAKSKGRATPQSSVADAGAPADEAPAPAPEAPIEKVEPSADHAPVFAASEPHVSEVPVDAPTAPKTHRTRKAKSDDDSFDLGLISEALTPIESSVSSDGYTRLIATAYIGIGNKLYIRGDGPGLSWDKGVPLEFVSIGKWRWETPDATKPMNAKLYKNDQVECAGLGSLTLEPGRQHEVHAGF